MQEEIAKMPKLSLVVIGVLVAVLAITPQEGQDLGNNPSVI